MDVIFYEKTYVRVSTEEPDQLRNDSLPVDFLRRQQWKPILKVEAKLSPKKTVRYIATSEIFIIDSIFDQIESEIEILLFWMLSHRRKIKK